ncbi:hypothetical protein RSOLAG1IB_11541 [Rhizoctonia solani AG-1 IB]|uniref:Uncharacterized protein n=1 Tax=Thanatephorus cucumeris (strain AG1-IB / isolate 7/3/14) TaxID=1108050 RepID=M5C3U5_THACB|nr:hypothetical protein BN14_07795 [Rhizoctonia solani AG-1 IB]CEL54009.1 hypothetical protein RSOLAG1IB_11541 [Rhizoctonia solani AG-1 IB]
MTVWSTVKNISQQVNHIADKVDQPDQGNSTRTVDKTPQAEASGKQQVKLEPPANIKWCAISLDESEGEGSAPAAQPSRSEICATSILVGTTSQSLSCTPGSLLKPIKVKAPEPFKGGTGTEAKQWAAQMSGWLQLSAT